MVIFVQFTETLEVLTSVAELYFMNRMLWQNKLLLRNDGNSEFNNMDTRSGSISFRTFAGALLWPFVCHRLYAKLLYC